MKKRVWHLAVCEACGHADLTETHDEGSPSGSKNYPECCHAGGRMFVQRRIVAVWEEKPVITWKAETL